MATARPRVLYPDAGPEPPYPLRMEGTVISGFGRGSKELGIPTANLPVDSAATPWIEGARSGVYFGWASLALPPTHADYPAATASTNAASSTSTSISVSTTADQDTTAMSTNSNPNPHPTSTNTNTDTDSNDAPPRPEYFTYPMVMSIGYNPFYKNSVRSAEVHVLHRFGGDFYGVPMRLLILGFVREEKDYAGLEALIEDINVDCDVARQSLARPAWTPREGVVVVDDGASTGRGRTGSLDAAWLVRRE